MTDRFEEQSSGLPPRGPGLRRRRADAQRNIDSLLQTAMTVFAAKGVDATVREIAEEAGVGIGTVYRHFPTRADLIAAVFRHEVDACADEATAFVTNYRPGEALARWIQRYVTFIAAKRGLAAALHGGDPAYDALPTYFEKRLRPVLQMLLEAGVDAGEVRADMDAYDLLRAIASLCMPTSGTDLPKAQRMVGLLVDGMRYGATKPVALSRSVLARDPDEN